LFFDFLTGNSLARCYGLRAGPAVGCLPFWFMSTSTDPIDPLLDRWRTARPPMPAKGALADEVWRRIADAEASPDENTFLASLENTFSRPSFAFAFVAACMLFGLFLAEIRVSRQQAQRNVQLAQAYVQLIDPLMDHASTGVSLPNSLTR
jgi:hypothetical protein